jgi:hypothetical protein
MAQHICATCWIKDKVKLQHHESSSSCPHTLARQFSKFVDENKLEDIFLPNFLCSNKFPRMLENQKNSHSSQIKSKVEIPVESHICIHTNKCSLCMEIKKRGPSVSQSLHRVKIHKVVKQSGKYNFESCRIRINDRINTDYLGTCLKHFDIKNYLFAIVRVWISFGFPG